MLRTLSSKLSSTARPFTIAIEGNIGCGKTTFLKHFKLNNDEILIASEPVNQWQNVRGHNLLQLMYEDREKWSFMFQTYVQLTMLQMHHLSGKSIKIMERSMHSARHCFVENLWRQGVMGSEQKAVLDEWYQWLQQEGFLDVDLIVYLRAPPETVYKRLQMRGRSEEKSVPLSLLEDLHAIHEEWLIHDKHKSIAPVLVLDANRPLESMSTEYERCNNQMREMLTGQQLIVQNHA